MRRDSQFTSAVPHSSAAARCAPQPSAGSFGPSLHAASLQQRALLLAAGAAMLFGYGTFLTSAPVEFGKLLGVYVVVFFLVAQVINFVAFGSRPTLPIAVGGLFIVAGGAIISAWRV
jgi:drug/metabolite transporter superfamily protein YnfA